MRLIALKLCWHNPSSKSSRLLIAGNLYIRIPPRLSLSFPVRSSLRSGYQWSPFLLWWHVSAIHFHLHGSELYTTVGYFTWSRGRGLIQLWRELDRGDLLKFYSYFCVSVGVMMMLGSFCFCLCLYFCEHGIGWHWKHRRPAIRPGATWPGVHSQMPGWLHTRRLELTMGSCPPEGLSTVCLRQTFKRSRNMWWPSFLRQYSWTIPG